MCHFTSFQWNVWKCELLREHRGTVVTQKVQSVYPVNHPRQPCQNAFSFRKKKRFLLPNFWRERKKKGSKNQMPLNQVPYLRSLPLSSSCWRWAGTDLLDQSPRAPPVWWQKSITQQNYWLDFMLYSSFQTNKMQFKVLSKWLTRFRILTMDLKMNTQPKTQNNKT